MPNVSRWPRCESFSPPATLSVAGTGRRQIYGLIERTLRAQQYLGLTKKDKGVVRRYLAKISGRSLSQITRLIRCTAKAEP